MLWFAVESSRRGTSSSRSRGATRRKSSAPPRWSRRRTLQDEVRTNSSCTRHFTYPLPPIHLSPVFSVSPEVFVHWGSHWDGTSAGVESQWCRIRCSASQCQSAYAEIGACFEVKTAQIIFTEHSRFFFARVFDAYLAKWMLPWGTAVLKRVSPKPWKSVDSQKIVLHSCSPQCPYLSKFEDSQIT